MKRIKSSQSTFLILIFVMANSANSQYSWPVQPLDQSQYISGTFCEYRDTGSSNHFHNGVDIPEPDGNPVYAVANGTVTAIVREGSNSYIRVGRYNYLHVVPNPSLSVGSQVTALETVVGTIRPGLGHIHFIDGYYDNEINPFRQNGGLTPYEDPWPPKINYVHFYRDNSEQKFSDNRISGKVDILVHIKERNAPPGSRELFLNNGSYEIGYRILSEDKSEVIYQPQNNGVKFRFDSKPLNRYVNNVFSEKLATLSKHVYIITNDISANNFWNISLLGPGRYTVMIWTMDTHFNADTAFVDVEVFEEDLRPPIPPVLKYVRGTDTGFELAWYQNPESDLFGYRLYFSNDLKSWRLHSDESRLDSATVEQNYPVRFPNPIYFRLSAVDNSPTPNESAFSDVYSIRNAGDEPKALIVDGFDRHGKSGGWNLPSHNFVTYYGKAIAANDAYFDVCSNDAVIDSSVDLQTYRMVFWLLGDESTADETFSAEEQQLVKSYLENGGYLFVSGSEVAFDLAVGDSLSRPSMEDSSFLHQFLKAEYVDDNAGVYQVEGSEGSIFDGSSFSFGSNPYNVSKPDFILPTNGSMACLKYQAAEKIAGIQYYGAFGSGNKSGKLVYLAFPFETIAVESQAEMMEQVLGFFNVNTGLVEFREITQNPEEFRLQQNYPNPFNPIDLSTRIIYYLPEHSHIKLRIYNIAGQLVRELVDKQQGKGDFFVKWNGRDNDGKMLPNGIYFCRLQYRNFSLTKRIVLLY